MNDYFAWPDSPRGRTSDADAIDAGGEQHAIAAVHSGSDMSTIFARTAERHQDTGSWPQARHPRHADGGCRRAQDESRQTARQRRATCPARRNGERRKRRRRERPRVVPGSDSGKPSQKSGRPTLWPASPVNAPYFVSLRDDVRDVRVPVPEQPSGLRLHRHGRCSGKRHGSSRQRTRDPAPARSGQPSPPNPRGCSCLWISSGAILRIEPLSSSAAP